MTTLAVVAAYLAGLGSGLAIAAWAAYRDPTTERSKPPPPPPSAIFTDTSAAERRRHRN